MSRPLEPDEDALAALLTRAGLPPASARAFAALARGGGWSAQDLAAATGLSRQDVSHVARELAERGLLRVEQVASGGRPSNRYHLARGVDASLRALIHQRRASLAQEEAALVALEQELGARRAG